LKMMLGELHKGYKRHEDSILELVDIVHNKEKEEELFRRMGVVERAQQENKGSTDEL